MALGLLVTLRAIVTRGKVTKDLQDLNKADRVEDRAREYVNSLNRTKLFSFDLANFAKKELESARLRQDMEAK